MHGLAMVLDSGAMCGAMCADGLGHMLVSLGVSIFFALQCC